MAAIHDRLYRSNEYSSIDFEEYLKALVPELLRSYGIGSTVKIELSAQEIKLGLDAAVPCALIINELVTNSLKHAFPKGETGKIKLTMECRRNHAVRLVVADNGIGMTINEDGHGLPKTLGLQMVTDLARQLDGSVTVSNVQGTQVQVDFSRID
jgi:two-component sensor histidine kinase